MKARSDEKECDDLDIRSEGTGRQRQGTVKCFGEDLCAAVGKIRLITKKAILLKYTCIYYIDCNNHFDASKTSSFVKFLQ